MQAVRMINTVDISKEDWLKARRNGIGGSDAAAIAGVNKWKSPIAVYLEKIGEIENDLQSEPAYWGSQLEELVAREFSTRTGLKVQRLNAILQHHEFPWMFANLDRVIMDPERGRGVLECKTTGAWNDKAWTEDQVPDEYMLQVQHYLAVTGFEYAYIAVLIGGQKYMHKYIARDDQIINYLIKIEADFWHLVENRTPPAVDGSKASTEVLNLLYKPEESTEDEVQLPDDAEAVIADYNHASQMIKDWEEAKDKAANRLKALLGKNSLGLTNTYKVSWKPYSTNRLDSKALKSEMPYIYKKYCKESATRRFTVTELKEAQ